jgi:hypothetical protein
MPFCRQRDPGEEGHSAVWVLHTPMHFPGNNKWIGENEQIKPLEPLTTPNNN